jgi:hypothetical protein
MLIDPLIYRLQCLGVLPETKDGYQIDWPDLDSPSDADKAAIALQKTQAMQAYVAGGVDQLIPPKQYLTMVIGMTDQEADAVTSEAEDYGAEHPHPAPTEQPGAQASAFTKTTTPQKPAPQITMGPNGIKAGIRGTATSPGDKGLGQPMPPSSIPPGAGVGGGTPAVPISGQKQRGKVQGTKGKGGTAIPATGPKGINPQGKPGQPQTQVKGKVKPGNTGGSKPGTKGNSQRQKKDNEQQSKH